jgi:CheY-like chemotaxis protein
LKIPRILIAEDDPDDQLLLESAFQENGVWQNIDFVDNGLELMSKLDVLHRNGAAAQFPDFIMLDLNMPGKNGKETLRDIKQHLLYKNIPVIIFTTTSDYREVRQCYEMGANSYIVKPPSFGRMVVIVKTVLDYWISTASISPVSLD